MCKNACTLQYLFTITVSKSVLIGAARLALFALQAQPTYYTAASDCAIRPAVVHSIWRLITEIQLRYSTRPGDRQFEGVLHYLTNLFFSMMATRDSGEGVLHGVRLDERVC